MTSFWVERWREAHLAESPEETKANWTSSLVPVVPTGSIWLEVLQLSEPLILWRTWPGGMGWKASRMDAHSGKDADYINFVRYKQVNKER